MAPSSQRYFSSNWKSADFGSNRQVRRSAIANVTRVTHSAIQRTLRCSAAPWLGSAAISNAPASGRKAMTESIGQLSINACLRRT